MSQINVLQYMQKLVLINMKYYAHVQNKQIKNLQVFQNVFSYLLKAHYSFQFKCHSIGELDEIMFKMTTVDTLFNYKDQG